MSTVIDAVDNAAVAEIGMSPLPAREHIEGTLPIYLWDKVVIAVPLLGFAVATVDRVTASLRPAVSGTVNATSVVN